MKNKDRILILKLEDRNGKRVNGREIKLEFYNQSVIMDIIKKMEESLDLENSHETK